MNLDRALEHAHAMNARAGADGTPPKGAARLYADIEYELAMGDPSSEQEHSGEAALAVLEEKYPGIKQRADDVVENGHIPRMSRKANSNVFPAEKHEEGESRPASTAVATRPSNVPAPARQRVQRARQVRSRPRGRGSAGQTARTVAYQLDSASGGWGSVAAYFLVGGVLLSILLLALRNTSSVARLETGITTAIGWVVNPAIDPLRPPGANRIPASRTAAPTPTPAGGFRP